jgi:hypothetical protein
MDEARYFAFVLTMVEHMPPTDPSRVELHEATIERLETALTESHPPLAKCSDRDWQPERLPRWRW